MQKCALTKKIAQIVKQAKLCMTSEWEVLLGTPDRANTPCLIHDTRHCQIDLIHTFT